MSRMFEWLAPTYIYMVMVGAIIGAVILVLRWRKMNRFVTMLVHAKWQSLLLHHFSRMRYAIKLVLLFISLITLLIAFMQPARDKKEDNVQQEGRDLLIALDVSRSMLAADIEPNRLECAKKKIRELLKHLNAERVGLILFSGSAFVHCPLTTDFHAFSLFLDQVDANTISSGTTAVEQAIARAIDVYETMPNKKTKLLVLMTDGEDFSDDLSDIKLRARKAGLHIFTMGIATQQGAPIPMYDHTGKRTGYIYDEQNNVVISRLNQELMNTLAAEVGGRYIPLSNDNADVLSIVRLIQRFEKESFGTAYQHGFEQQYHYLTALTFVCLALEWVL